MPKWAGDDNTGRRFYRAKEPTFDPKFLAFDLETSKITRDDIGLLAQRPLGISCAVTMATGDEPMVWQGGKAQMTPLQCRRMVEYLSEMVRQGYTIVTWNGAGFDFNVLGEESGLWETCKKLALSSIDMMFHLFCAKGFAVGLNAVAQGMGLPTKGGSGADVPRLWAEGKRQEVLDYVRQDGIVTLAAFQAIQRSGCIKWISKSSGKLVTYDLPKKKLLTVKEAMALPLPDTSWMKKECVFCEERVPCLAIECPECGCKEFTGDPWSRSRFTGWLKSPIPVPNVERWEY